MMRSLFPMVPFLFYCALLCSFAMPHSLAQEISPVALKQATETLENAVASEIVAGALHVVHLDGQTAHQHVDGQRDIEDGKLMRPDTIVRIYSMTKPITSVAAMTLFEKGKFELDDPVGKYIPAFLQTTVLSEKGENGENDYEIIPAKRQITVRDLLRHTSGYSYGGGGPDQVSKAYRDAGMSYRPPNAMLPPDMSIAQAADALASVPALHHPGERFTYGFNTDIVGRLIEIWSGQPLDVYMKASIFDPLDMVDTGFVVRPENVDRFASCHSINDGSLVVCDKYADSAFTKGFKFLSGGGGLVSTMHDYVNFCQMIVDRGEFNGHRILAPTTIDLMLTNQLGDVAGDFKFGLGFAIEEVEIGTGEQSRTATQYSWGGYASTAFRIVPDERLIQIVLRQQVPQANGLASQLFPLVYKGLSKED